MPNAEKIGIYTLSKHDLRFHKLSKKDRSGKCDAFFTENETDFVIGVLFEIDENKLKNLDDVEGVGYGYARGKATVVNTAGDSVVAITYYAEKKYIDKKLRPFTWYKQHVLCGAVAAGLPDYYVAKITAVEAVDDDKDKGSKTRMDKAIAVHSDYDCCCFLNRLSKISQS